MDIIQYIFPLVMAVLTNSFMIVIIYFLRKLPIFSFLSGVWSMVALYLLCVLRVMLPIELFGSHLIIVEKTVYNALIDAMIVRHSDHHSPSALLIAILVVWVAGALIIGIIFAVKQRSFRTYILSNCNDATDADRAALSRAAISVLGSDRNISLYKTDAVSRIMVMGYFKKMILLPVGDYSADQLDMIFRHECMHIKNKDLWIKLMIQIYCCIFWWNPFSYLLKHDLSFSLEMKCDLSVVRNFTPEQTLLYLNTLHTGSKPQMENRTDHRESFLVCAELSDVRKNNELIKRVKAITSDPPKRATSVIANTLAVLAVLSVFLGSYFVIVQSSFGTDVPDDQIDAPEGSSEIQMIDVSDAYLVKQDDGSYLLYIEGYPPVPVSKDEVDAGYYDGYPILEN